MLHASRAEKRQLLAVVAELCLESFKRICSAFNIMRDGYQVVLNDSCSIEIEHNPREKCSKPPHSNLGQHVT